MAIVTSISNINLGDKILCKYTASNGSIGIFNEFSATIASLISTTSSATPNGSFYWIYVGKDYLGRKKFIADRNLQHSISWDSINNSGFIFGKTIDLGLGINYTSTIRSLTGGTATADTDNEWDKIISSSTLGGSITAGDNTIWNWNGIASWTSSTGTTSANKIIRGNTTVSTTNAPTGLVTTTVNTTTGFRPVLVIEHVIFYKYLIKQNSNYYSINSNYYNSTTTHNFTALTLEGGATPNNSDINTYGFSDLSALTTNMVSGGDSFIPIDKLNSQFDIKMYKG